MVAACQAVGEGGAETSIKRAVTSCHFDSAKCELLPFPVIYTSRGHDSQSGVLRRGSERACFA